MNQLFIIGNGFDLAHGLDTRYSDFIIWYLKRICIDITENLFSGYEVDDDLIRIYSDPIPMLFDNIQYRDNLNQKVEKMSSIQDFVNCITDLSTDYSQYNKKFDYYPSELLYSILGYLDTFGWADIEREYYKLLISTKDISELNLSFSKLKSELELYLMEQVEPFISVDKKKDHFHHLLFYELIGNTYSFFKDEVLYLNFNYTNTFEKIYFSKQERGKNIYIHGKCLDKENPVIFGYGDEMDEHFESIEKKEDNAFLDNMKSFGYFQTDNYKKVLLFLRAGNFKVHLIGHSLGLSDRLLFNTIFEHANCKHIEIHFWKISESEDNFYELAKNLSRHFNLGMKGSMREKVVPYLDSKPID